MAAAEKAAHGSPHIRVAEQIEVVYSARPPAQVDGKRDVLAAAAPPECAGRLDEQIADDSAERVTGISGDGEASR